MSTRRKSCLQGSGEIILEIEKEGKRGDWLFCFEIG